MEDDNKCEVGHFLEFYFKCFLVDYFKPKLSVIYYIAYTTNIPIIP